MALPSHRLFELAVRRLHWATRRTSQASLPLGGLFAFEINKLAGEDKERIDGIMQRRARKRTRIFSRRPSNLDRGPASAGRGFFAFLARLCSDLRHALVSLPRMASP